MPQIPAFNGVEFMSTVIRTEKRKRGFFGWIFLLLFWGFNALMAFGFFAGLSNNAQQAALMTSEAEQAGYAIGTALGVGMLLTIWVLGAILLGIFVLLTRGKKIIVETTPV